MWRWVLHILIPLLCGIAIYLLCNDQKLLLNKWLNLPVLSIPFNKTGMVRSIRNHVPDMLWAYSFTFYINLSLRSMVDQIRIYIICIALTIMSEMIQLIPGLGFTFDFVDLILILISSLIAIHYAKKVRKIDA